MMRKLWLLVMFIMPNIQNIQNRCENQDAKSCFDLGILYVNGQKFLKAKEYWEKSCELNYGAACFNLGLLYEIGYRVRQNYSKAKQLFGKACDLGLQTGCKNYAILNKQGY